MGRCCPVCQESFSGWQRYPDRYASRRSLSDISAYAPHAQALSRNYMVIRMEHFNVQYADENRTLPADYSVKMESEAIGKTLDSLNIKEPVVLVGWSYGAVIAYDFALHHPRRIRCLYCLSRLCFGLLLLKMSLLREWWKCRVIP